MRRKVENRTLPSVSAPPAASEGFSLKLAWCHFLHLLLLRWLHPSGAPENVSAQLHPMSFTQPIVTSEDPKNKWFLRDSDSYKTWQCSLWPSAAEFPMNRSAVWGWDEQTDITVLVCICSTCDWSLCGRHMLVPVHISACVCSYRSASQLSICVVSAFMCVAVCINHHFTYSKYNPEIIFCDSVAKGEFDIKLIWIR